MTDYEFDSFVSKIESKIESILEESLVPMIEVIVKNEITPVSLDVKKSVSLSAEDRIKIHEHSKRLATQFLEIQHLKESKKEIKKQSLMFKIALIGAISTILSSPLWFNIVKRFFGKL